MMPNVTDLYAGRPPELRDYRDLDERPTPKRLERRSSGAIDQVARLTRALLSILF